MSTIRTIRAAVTRTAATRTAGAVAALGVLLGAAAACAGDPPPGPQTPESQTPPVSAPPVSRPAPTPTPGPPTPTDSTDLPRCTTSELAVSLGQGGAAAGSVYRPLVFTNTGSRTCELRGFPGVSYVAGDDGHQVGPAAAMSGERGGPVPIPPGGAAQAQLQLVNVQNYDPADCAPTPVRGLRVYPPGDTEALFVPLEGTGCARTPPGNQLSVRTVMP